jgi:hypothetical protein
LNSKLFIFVSYIYCNYPSSNWRFVLFIQFQLSELHPFTIYLFVLALPHIRLQPPNPHILLQLIAY